MLSVPLFFRNRWLELIEKASTTYIETERELRQKAYRGQFSGFPCVCLCVCLFDVCLFVCLFVCLLVCLSVRRFICQSACLST